MTKHQAISLWNRMVSSTDTRVLLSFIGSEARDIPAFRGDGQDTCIPPVVDFLKEMILALEDKGKV